jgi:hypothetical protein
MPGAGCPDYKGEWLLGETGQRCAEVGEIADRDDLDRK